MPYIMQERREWAVNLPEDPGELNYAVTAMIDDYLGPNLSYGELNAVIGVLECVKLELYRRLAAPYEDRKRHENGDVYQERS